MSGFARHFWGPLFCLFCCFTSQVNSYGHCGTVSSTQPHFFLGKLEQAVNQYFVHILSLATDNNPSWMIQRKGGEWLRNYFMINLHESMGPGRDPTCDPWICSQTRICCQTRYRLRYAARWGPLWSNSPYRGGFANKFYWKGATGELTVTSLKICMRSWNSQM